MLEEAAYTCVHVVAGWPAVSTPVLRALAGKPGAAKHALEDLYGVTDFKSSTDEGKLRHPCTVSAGPVHWTQHCTHEEQHVLELICFQCAC